MTLEFTIITVNYNNSALLIEVLDRTLCALDGRAFEAVIVDNGSPDDSIVRLSEHYSDHPKVKLVASGINGGFGFGCNKGAATAESNYYWFLNSDAWLVSDNGLDDALALLRERDSGIVGTSVILDNSEATPQGGSDMSFRYFLASSFRPGALFRRLPSPLRRVLVPLLAVIPGIFGKYASSFQSIQTDAIFESRGVGGASFLIRKDVYDALGGFDEQFFLYDEDGDLCLRCSQLGKTNFVAPAVKVMTYPSATTSKVGSIALKKIKRESRLLLVSKHFSGVQRWILQAVTLLTWRLL